MNIFRLKKLNMKRSLSRYISQLGVIFSKTHFHLLRSLWVEALDGKESFYAQVTESYK